MCTRSHAGNSLTMPCILSTPRRPCSPVAFTVLNSFLRESCWNWLQKSVLCHWQLVLLLSCTGFLMLGDTMYAYTGTRSNKCPVCKGTVSNTVLYCEVRRPQKPFPQIFTRGIASKSPAGHLQPDQKCPKWPFERRNGPKSIQNERNRLCTKRNRKGTHQVYFRNFDAKPSQNPKPPKTA